MRVVAVFLISLIITPAYLSADVIHYKASGFVDSVVQGETPASNMVSEGDAFQIRFALDTESPIADQFTSPTEQAVFYKQNYPITVEFSSGFWFEAIPRVHEEDWTGREQHRWLSFAPTGEQLYAEHFTGNNSGFGGHDFLFSTPFNAGFIDLLTMFQEVAPPFGITTAELTALPGLSEFDYAGFEFYVFDAGEPTFIAGAFNALTEIPGMSCFGFLPPLQMYPVSVKKNRVLPLKMQLFDDEGVLVTDRDVATPPSFQIMFSPNSPSAPIDVTTDAEFVGEGANDYQFVFTDEGYWQYNLKIRNFSEPGTYTVRVVSGDEWNYVIDPSCETSLLIE